MPVGEVHKIIVLHKRKKFAGFPSFRIIKDTTIDPRPRSWPVEWECILLFYWSKSVPSVFCFVQMEQSFTPALSWGSCVDRLKENESRISSDWRGETIWNENPRRRKHFCCYDLITKNTIKRTAPFLVKLFIVTTTANHQDDFSKRTIIVYSSCRSFTSWSTFFSSIPPSCLPHFLYNHVFFWMMQKLKTLFRLVPRIAMEVERESKQDLLALSIYGRSVHSDN